MTFSPEQKQMLSAKLDSGHVKTRKQAGRDLSYVEGWFAIAEANRIFGYDGWNRETVDLRQLGEPREVDAKFRVAYMAKVRITVGTIIREGCGYGSGIDRDLGGAHESALKEAETDAMKRAFMTFGNPFGLALYDKEQGGVEHEKPAAPAKAPPAPPASASGGWDLANPQDGTITSYERPSALLSDLEACLDGLPRESQQKWWTINEKTCLAIAAKHPAQAGERVRKLQQQAQGKAA